MKDKKSRTLIKTISWRATATTITVVLVFIFTGNLVLSFGIGFSEMIIKLIGYYYHERIWNYIPWGKHR